MSAAKKLQMQNETVKTHFPHLKVIQGGLNSMSKKEKRIEQFWLFCQAALWNNIQFSKEESKECKLLISEHFKKGKSIDKTFKQLVERVCLAKRYVTRKKGRYISKAVDWLNINYKNGLASTANWYKTVEEQRETVPHYNEGIALLSQAILNHCEHRDILDIIHFRRELMVLKQYDLLQIYMNSIMHIDYLNL